MRDPVLYVAHQPPDHLVAAWQGALLCGYFPADKSRVDLTLDTAHATVRSSTDVIGGVEAVVVNAATEDAAYTVWFAPDRGGCIVKMVRVLEEAALEREHQARKARPKSWMPPNETPEEDVRVRVTQILDDVQVERFDNVWLPVSGTYTEQVVRRSGATSMLVKKVHRKRVELNPHTRHVSFVPDIPDGTKVIMVGEHNALPREWRGGTIIPREDPQTTARLRSVVGTSRFIHPIEGAGTIGAVLIGPASFVVSLAAGSVVWLLLARRARRS